MHGAPLLCPPVRLLLLCASKQVVQCGLKQEAMALARECQLHAVVQLGIDQTRIGGPSPRWSTVLCYRVADSCNVFAFTPHVIPASFARRLFRLSSFLAVLVRCSLQLSVTPRYIRKL